ncbi:hypothetical protein A2962_04515 [Candidatus Woesebacteria bacterium RIFCSPLOWO2_01_FULL_39_61]|uniref:Uncharacterized protein n=1 Tax=Candidatus Woesebacteria bacterium RIFCSPHIGHO2_02_FULL_39_13 TaxID=1802505 RepID=A0A1F7YXB8_9BACT|nr:MAG: hypothetical protein A2692_05825 [Candidatus Woesebacteria bacterium RIFCSPHIGHO2_01_FULL_39_95]OGM31931.1 MAG: hypothetical protein A3D01_00680 [Candidatus Woesebacteria bacterium RIFCSPHIGHO2_02_FULL_39_13]OGM36495.1 MAG: hypothetical protein A3E13_02455 [Candidatus Woesebacteria bacterium RIFCSPHIGHO2_12_FULL_40_20]OGM65517.1 MAG: hypothetical protein A2962_04515 [Candidatus Woesebacteria bacterium RIFCSPLOWO2_01_FULL_39_61]
MPLIKRDLELIRFVVKNVLEESFKDPNNPLRKEIRKSRDELKTEIRKIGDKVNKLDKIHPQGHHLSL